jgi:antitoxin MazE
MEAKVVRIGNSQGVRIPKAALQQTRLSAGQRVRLEVVEDTIVIRPDRKVRHGWKEAFARANAADTEDLWQGVPHDEAWDE